MFYNNLLKFSEGKPSERLNIKGEKPSEFCKCSGKKCSVKGGVMKLIVEIFRRYKRQ